MAKTSYLNMTNALLRRINQSVITDVTSVSGHSEIITNLINEAQNELYTEINWYSLYTTRTFPTVASTEEYAVASDWGRTIDMMDTTNNRFLIEDRIRSFDMSDPDADRTGVPLYFGLQGSNFRLHPIPDGIYTIRERYWKVPTTLAANADISDLPIEAENAIIHWAWYKVLEYMNKFELADRTRIEYLRTLKKARMANQKVLDRMFAVGGPSHGGYGIAPPKWPSNYGPSWRY